MTKEDKHKKGQNKPVHCQGIYERFFKRPLDLFLALSALVVLSPLLGVTALLVRVRLGSPVIFHQERPGLNGRIFTLCKFRSMTDKKDANGNLLPDEARLTAFGKKLRSTSLDELPELINIIRGDMSIVGPRPLLVQYLPLYNEHQARRHEVRPGLTGLAQISGRNALTWEEKFEFDVKYVDHITFCGDLKIITDTVRSVLHHEGISAAGEATMAPFTGSDAHGASDASVDDVSKSADVRQKILILGNNAVGLFRFRRELIRTLLKEYDVFISDPDGEEIRLLEQDGARFVRTDIDRRGMNPLTDAALFMHYLRIFKNVRPDFVISYTIKPNIYGGLACRCLHLPYAANITGLGTSFEKPGFLRKTVTVMYKTALRKASVVFFENSENRELFVKEKIVAAGKTCVLNGAGVDTREFSALPYPSDKETFRFLFIGRVMKEKGVEELLKAVRRLQTEVSAKTQSAASRQQTEHAMQNGNAADHGREDLCRFTSVRLDILGDLEENYRALIQRCEAEGWLVFHGVQADVRPFIAECHALVLPSWHEGMANTNLEAASSARPVITSRIAGCKEAVDDGRTGLLVTPGSALDLYIKMKEMMELPRDARQEMGEKGREKMLNSFDKKAVVEKTLRRLKDTALNCQGK